MAAAMGMAGAAVGSMMEATAANMLVQQAGTLASSMQNAQAQASAVQNEGSKQATAAVSGVSGGATEAVKSAFSK
jgi:hypothetical protein